MFYKVKVAFCVLRITITTFVKFYSPTLGSKLNKEDSEELQTHF